MWPGHCRWPERRIKHSTVRGDRARGWARVYMAEEVYIPVYIKLCCHGPQRQWTKIITTNGLLRENAASNGEVGGWRLEDGTWRMAW